MGLFRLANKETFYDLYLRMTRSQYAIIIHIRNIAETQHNAEKNTIQYVYIAAQFDDNTQKHQPDRTSAII